MTGKVRIGVTVIVSVGSKSESRVIQSSFGRPLISAEQEPHLPALQFQRIARSPVWVAGVLVPAPDAHLQVVAHCCSPSPGGFEARFARTSTTVLARFARTSTTVL